MPRCRYRLRSGAICNLTTEEGKDYCPGHDNSLDRSSQWVIIAVVALVSSFFLFVMFSCVGYL